MSKIDLKFWKNKRVFITGHTGFKGSWLLFWLYKMGAHVTGYSLANKNFPNMFDVMKSDEFLDENIIADIRNLDELKRALKSAKPEIIFHLAAQPLVFESYKNPIDTYSTNVMGTANLLECCRELTPLRSVVIVTTDKCYQNKELSDGYKENDHLGGNDPYSSSKACAELVTAAYRATFFQSSSLNSNCMVATTRAGNVFGGGDWSDFRLIPDLVKYLSSGTSLKVRNPTAIRPWQFVTEPLAGYILLAQKMYNSHEFSQAWNFGPPDDESIEVRELMQTFFKLWDSNFSLNEILKLETPFKEEKILRLNCEKSLEKLGWTRNIPLKNGIQFTVEWYKKYYAGCSSNSMRNLTWNQIQNSMPYNLHLTDINFIERKDFFNEN